MAGVLFVEESYMVPADIQYEAWSTKPRQFSGLTLGVNFRYDKCAVMTNCEYSVANFGNCFPVHAHSFPQAGTECYLWKFKLISEVLDIAVTFIEAPLPRSEASCVEPALAI